MVTEVEKQSKIGIWGQKLTSSSDWYHNIKFQRTWLITLAVILLTD